MKLTPGGIGNAGLLAGLGVIVAGAAFHYDANTPQADGYFSGGSGFGTVFAGYLIRTGFGIMGLSLAVRGSPFWRGRKQKGDDPLFVDRCLYAGPPRIPPCHPKM